MMLVGNGYGDGDGYGYGYGDGDGYGDGHGDGYGYGDGHGDGHGDGYGYGDGYGNGNGYGTAKPLSTVPYSQIRITAGVLCKVLTSSATGARVATSVHIRDAQLWELTQVPAAIDPEEVADFEISLEGRGL